MEHEVAARHLFFALPVVDWIRFDGGCSNCAFDGSYRRIMGEALARGSFVAVPMQLYRSMQNSIA
jgi:hypothetical protein